MTHLRQLSKKLLTSVHHLLNISYLDATVALAGLARIVTLDIILAIPHLVSTMESAPRLENIPITAHVHVVSAVKFIFPWNPKL